MERNIITLKTRRNAENACVNGMWQLGFRKTFIAKDQMSLNSQPSFFQLVIMMGVRKMLELIFTQTELKILDDTLPEFRRKEKLDHEDALEQEVIYLHTQLWAYLGSSASRAGN